MTETGDQLETVRISKGAPEVLATMLDPAPAPVRKLLPRIAPLVYARHCRAVYGTPYP